MVEKPTLIELPPKSKLFGKRSSCLLRNTPIHTPENEDEIITMVEMQKDKETNNTNNIKQDISTNKSEQNCEHQANAIKDMQLQALTPIIQNLCKQVCPDEEVSYFVMNRCCSEASNVMHFTQKVMNMFL